MVPAIARFASLGLALGLSASVLAACRTNFEDSCDPGTLGCECLPDEACVSGLSCYEGLCAQVGGSSTDESGEAGSASSEDGSGDGDGDGENLFQDPGFEGWTAGLIPAWEVSAGTATQESTEVFAGASALRFESTGYGTVGQTVAFSPPIGNGTCVLVRAQMAYAGGETVPPGILMSGMNDEGEEFLAGDGVTWGVDGEFHEVVMIVVPEGTVSTANVFFNAPADPQNWILDEASLSRTPCP
jgi:hypothetical protein